MSAPPTVAPPPPRERVAPAPVERPNAPGPRRPPARPTLLPVHVARMIGFVGLAGFGALQWAAMVKPGASDALLASVLLSALAGYGLVVAARRPRATTRGRLAATIFAAAVLLVIALALAGVSRPLFGPHGWDDLVDGIAQGLGAVSTVRTPYAGLDEWTRIVLILGGCALTGVAALLAFAPRRRGALGFPAAAAVALGVLYTVPVMQHDIRLPWLAGLTFTLLLATFLWLERIEHRSAGLAAALVATAALGGYVAAPALDGEKALLDYEEIAQSLSPSATTQYRWNHGYGPLDWPRDGREVLRVKAARRSYWKAVNLVAFDGMRWIQDTGQDRDALETLAYDPDWVQTIRVTMRSLRTRQFVTAGSAIDIRDSPRNATSIAPGVYESTSEPLRRGHAYRAIVYTPRPSTAQLRAAPPVYPSALPREYDVVGLPSGAGGRGPALTFPRWNEAGTPSVVGAFGTDAGKLLADSPYGEVYDLARRLRTGTDTPFEYMRAIERYLAGDDFSYSETPRRSTAPLADFLLRDRSGYCQQFSGAMALLLRMGGVPARVASGFSPGILDTERKEYVVRDVDAHSWVEVFVPGIGWVTRDPTPPDSPARTQTADLTVGGQDQTVTFGGSERALDRVPDSGGGTALPTTAGGEGGPSTLVVVGAVVLSLVLAGLIALLVRRRVRRTARDATGVGADPDAELAELLRALRRSSRIPPPQLTLDGLAGRLAGTPAQEYVRTLADARYGYGDARPTRAQRAALRRELGAGMGRRGRLRAWWALPPQLTRTGSASSGGRRILR